MKTLALFPEIDQINKENLQKVDNILKLFGDIHNHIYANDGLSSQDAFYEFLKVLFIKVEDERNLQKYSGFYITDSEIDEINDGKGIHFKERINKLFELTKKDYFDIFEEKEKISLKLTTLAFIVNKLQHSKLSDGERDIKGLAFQKFIFNHQRGQRGQFFTPDPVVRMCVEILVPKVSDSILDPACGTGGFLLQALSYLKENKQKPAEKQRESNRFKLYGFDINPLITKVLKMRMILEGNEKAGVLNTDSLQPYEGLKNEIYRKLAIHDCSNYFDIILTNPPFGSQGKISNDSILRDYILSYKWKRDDKGGYRITNELQNGQVPDILFIERCFSLLKDGGKMAIVLPNGDFENTSLSYVRDFIKNNGKILAVIALPPETFIPHGTGVKASLLFVQKLSKEKLEKEKKNNYSIFFAKILKIGYEGNKNGSLIYKKSDDGKYMLNNEGDKIIDEDITNILNEYHKFKGKGALDDNEWTFTVDYKNIKDRLDVEFYSPKYKWINQAKHKNNRKLYEVAEIVNEKCIKLKYPDQVIKYVELSDVNPFYGELVSFNEMKVHEAPSRASYEVRMGDIITAVAGNSVGTKHHATAYIDEKVDDMVCTNGFRVIKAKDINPYYLFMFLKSNVFLSQIFRLRTGAAIPSVSDDDLRNIIIPIPSIEEQKIVERKVKKMIKLRKESKEVLFDLHSKEINLV